MNSLIIKPLAKFVKTAQSGTWICDFQFNHISFASKDMACTIRARVNASSTTFVIDIIDIEDEDIDLCNKRQECW